MTYLSQFSGSQIDQAIRAVRNGMIDASVFRAKIATLSANASGTLSSLSTTPTLVDLYGGDPLLLINSNGQSTNFFLDLLDGEILPEGSTTLPIRDDLGDPVPITALEGDGVYLEGNILFDRFNDFGELIELQNISISNLSNSLLLNNSVGVIGVLLEDYLEVVDQETLLVNLYIDLEVGNTFTLLDTANFTLVECTLTTGVSAGGNQTLNIEPISGSFLEGQPLGLGGETFMSSIQLDRDRINLLSSTIASSGSIASTTAQVESDNQIPITGLSVDLKAGAKIQIVFPDGALGPVVEVDQDINAGGSPLMVAQVITDVIPNGSFLHLESAYMFSQIQLTPEQISLIATEVKNDIQLSSFVTITSSRVTVETPVMANDDWAGAVNLDGSITSFSSELFPNTEGVWAISNNAHFEFYQDPSNYFRSKGLGFEFRGKVFGASGVIIDDDGFVDNTIPGSSLMPGSIIANKLANNYRRMSTDIEFEGSYDPQTITIIGTFLNFEMGSSHELGGGLPQTLTVSPGRNYLYFNTTNNTFAITTNPDNVFTHSDRALVAMAWQGNNQNQEPPTVISGVASNIYGSEVIAANSISGDKIVANSITGTKIAGFSITGDKITAKTKMVIGEGVVGNQGVIILQGEDSEQWRILVGAIKGDIENNALNANFRLNDQGHLFASGATVSGTITASGGSITGNLSVTGTLEIGSGGSLRTDDSSTVFDQDGIRFNLPDNLGIKTTLLWGASIGSNSAHIGGFGGTANPSLEYRSREHQFRDHQGEQMFALLSTGANRFVSLLGDRIVLNIDSLPKSPGAVSVGQVYLEEDGFNYYLKVKG